MSGDSVELKQAKFLEAYFAQPYKTIKETCKEVGISNRTVDSWKRENIRGFNDKIDAETNRLWSSMREKATRALDEMIEEKDFRAVKYALDYHGYAPEQKVKVESETNVNINIE